MSYLPFIPNTDADRAAMLKRIGVPAFDALIANIPKELRWQGDLPIPEGLSEPEIVRELTELAAQNEHAGTCDMYLGAGAYDHYIPAVIDHIITRSEWYTAYTPYQPEVSQGTLQVIYEYQSMVCELLGMDVGNASLYDGGSAAAEAVLLAGAATRRSRILLGAAFNPRHREVIATYTTGQNYQLETVPSNGGVMDIEALTRQVGGDCAAVVVQFPNFFGVLEDLKKIAAITHQCGALFIVSSDLIPLGVLEPPGACGADIVVAEGQQLGNALSYGGPYLGVFAATKALVRKIPGRLAGRTKDTQGREGFVLTLQTREQHIRREKATSNICTNQALNALVATIYLTLMGPQGLRDVADSCIQKAHYLAGRIQQIPGFALTYSGPFAREFAVQTPIPACEVVARLKAHHIMPGLSLEHMGMEHTLLIAVTEKRTVAQMDRFVVALASLAGEGA